jgi:CheY-like chemotaxis protein
MSARAPTILLLEHDEADVFFFRRALTSVGYTGQVRVVHSVGEARDYLTGRGMFADREYYPLPDLIVSDLKVPGRTGLEFLHWVREQQDFREIPFVMYSGSATGSEGSEVVKAGARAFIRKEVDFNQAISAVGEVLKHLPPR